MKRNLILMASAGAGLLQCHVHAAPIAIPAGGLTYTQNFNTLSTTTNNGVTTAPWTNDSTIPGWWLFRAGNAVTPVGFVVNNYNYLVADGNAATNAAPLGVGQFYSMGADADPDRALGSPSTTGQGELSAIAVFENTGTAAVELSTIKYAGEVRRTNNGANNDSLFVWFRKGASLAQINTITTAPATAAIFPAEVSTGPTSYYITGWTQLTNFTYTYANASLDTPVVESQPFDDAPSSVIRINPGEFFSIRWSNINDGGNDALLGFDDVELTFTEVNAAVNPVVSNVVRNNSGTPQNPADDTIEFTLTVAGLGAVNPAGWTISSPPALAGTTGTYGTAKNITGVPIAEFTAAPHEIVLRVEDQGAAATFDNATVTAPWAVLTPSATNFVYADGGTPNDVLDDSVTYDAQATGSFTGTDYTLTVDFNPPQTVAYGVTATINATPGGAQTLTFVDSADATVTTTLVVNSPAVIGTNSLSGSPANLFSRPGFGTRNWVLDGGTRIMRQNTAAQADHVIETDVLDLSAVGAVKVSADLDAIAGTSSGFEAADYFQIQMIVDGGAPVSILGSADVDGDGRLEGDPAAGLELPGATVLNTTKPFNFIGIVPAAANSVQIRIVGNSNSPSETYEVKNLLVEPAPHSLLASTGTVTMNNQGTVNPADDTFSVPVTITPVANPAGSTGWTSTITPGSPGVGPATGNYSDANPVVFGPFLVSAGAQTIQLTDNGNAAVMSQALAVNPPAPTITIVLPATPVVRNENNPADPGDDTVTFEITTSGANGGPQFAINTRYPVTATVTSATLNAAATTTTVTLSPAPDHGTLYVRAVDGSYPTAAGAVDINVPVPLPTTPATQYILGRKDLGAGLSNVTTAVGAVLAPEWINFPGVRAMSIANDATAVAKTVESEVIDLSAVAGPVNFSATLRAIDTTVGFEANDTFVAQLILDGDTANPVNLITPYDLVAVNGMMNGGDLAADDEFNAAKDADGSYVSLFPLSHVIGDEVQNVKLVLTGVTNSINEAIVVDNVLFAVGGPVTDADSDGMPDAYEDANGLNKNDAGDKNTDLDGDGQSNYQEFLAGNTANDPASVLKVTSVTRTGNSASVTWTSIPGKNYRIEISGNMAAWTPSNLVPAAAAPATETSSSLDLTPLGNPLPGKYFLRVKVE